jgi:hypothetical protein
MSDPTPSETAMQALVTALVTGGLAYLLLPLLGGERELGFPITLGLLMGAVTLWQSRPGRRRDR